MNQAENTQEPPEDQEQKPNDDTQKENKPAAPIVAITNKGWLDFNNHLELANSASIAIRTELAPKNLRNQGKEAVMAALLFCKQHNLPQSALSQLAVIHGRIAAFGSLFMALAQRHPLWGPKREFFIDEDQKLISFANKNLDAIPWGAVIQIKPKGSEDWNEYFFTMKDAERAGLDKPKRSKSKGGGINSDSPWIKYVQDMLKHKARKRAFTAEYASALEGIEYYEDIREVKEIRDVGPTAFGNDSEIDAAEEFNKEIEVLDEQQ